MKIYIIVKKNSKFDMPLSMIMYYHDSNKNFLKYSMFFFRLKDAKIYYKTITGKNHYKILPIEILKESE